jgi:hypothetical protein
MLINATQSKINWFPLIKVKSKLDFGKINCGQTNFD